MEYPPHARSTATNRHTGHFPDPPGSEPTSGDRHSSPDFFSELKRRKVYRVGVAYLAAAFAGLEGADLVLPVLGLGPAAFNGLVVLSLLGFPLALALAWTFDVTGEGIRRTASPESPELPVVVVDRWGRLKAALVGAGFVLVVWMGVRAWQPLRAPAGPAEAGGEPMLAVLPFQDFSPGSDQVYFADGLHDEVLHQLAAVPGIRLMSRTSVQHFRASALPAPAIADSLGADYILEGSLRTAEDEVNLTVQLIDGATDEHLWSESLTRSWTVEGLIDLQNTLARRVAGALGATLGSGRQGGGAPTSSLAAYHAYLRGLHHLGIFDIDDLWAAVEDFERAVELDPEFGQAHARLALTLGMSNNYGQRRQGDLFPRMRHHAQEAMRLIPDDPQAHMAMLSIHWPIEWDWAAARNDLQRALELDPNLTDALWALAEWEGVIAGNTDRGLELLRRAETLEPNSPRIMAMRMWVLMNARRWDEAVEEGRRILELDPDNVNTALNVASSLSLGGRPDEGRALLLPLLEALPRPYPPDMAAHVARIGERERAREIVRRGVALRASGGDVPASGIAIGYAALGEVDQALDWLERSFTEEGGIYYLRHADWDNVAREPRFQALWDQVGLRGRQSSLEVSDP